MPRTNTERLRLEALLDQQTKKVRAAFGRFVLDVRSERVMRDISKLLERSQIDEALRIVDSYIDGFGNVIPKVIASAGDNQTKLFKEKLTDFTTAVSFDTTRRRTAEIIQNSKMRLVQNLSAQQREAVKAALTEGVRNGFNSGGLAQSFKDVIGLTNAQRRAVRNYRTLLETGSREATERALRNQRFDAIAQEAIDEGSILRGSQIDRMVSAYRTNMLGMRANAIAQTQTLQAVNIARDEALHQITDDLNLDSREITREWNATQDDVTRDTHSEMDGQVVGLDEPFESPTGELIMYPGDPKASAKEIVNCRCWLSFGFNPSALRRAA